MENNKLLVRRARFVYEACRLHAIASQALIVPAPFGEREQDFKNQFYQVIEQQCGPNRCESPKALHESWVQAYLKNGWVYGPKYDPINRVHPDLVAYDQLEERERVKDDVFIACCEIARKWIT